MTTIKSTNDPTYTADIEPGRTPEEVSLALGYGTQGLKALFYRPEALAAFGAVDKEVHAASEAQRRLLEAELENEHAMNRQYAEKVEALQAALAETEASIGIRAKALEIAVRQWCSPEAKSFDIVERAAYFEKYIREGREKE